MGLDPKCEMSDRFRLRLTERALGAVAEGTKPWRRYTYPGGLGSTIEIRAYQPGHADGPVLVIVAGMKGWASARLLTLAYEQIAYGEHANKAWVDVVTQAYGEWRQWVGNKERANRRARTHRQLTGTWKEAAAVCKSKRAKQKRSSTAKRR